jgi:hypothetical protein
MKLSIAIAALMFNCGGAFAGDYALLSMQYSADQFVPHIRFDGIIVPGDAQRLAALFERTLGCDQTCPGPSAVLTLNSVGGNFVEAQAIADLLHAHHVATVIEADQSCYGACAIAFSGGSALGADGAIVPDRTVVPGAHIAVSNFNQPHEGLAHAILAHGIDTVLGGTPAELEALANSGQWRISSIVSPFLNGMMDWGLDLANAEGIYILDARLPTFPRADIEPVQATAVLNACSYLIARHEGQTPGDMIEQPDLPFIESLSTEAGETLMGYEVSGMEDFSFCGTPATNAPFETIGLYNLDDGGLHEVDSHNVELAMLLDPYLRLGDLESVFAPYVEDAHFESSGLVYLTHENESLAGNPFGIETLYRDKYRRISRVGDIMIYEQAGGAGLFEAAAAYMKGPAIIKSQLSESPGITTLSGRYADSGNRVLMMAFDGQNDVTVRVEFGKPQNELSAEEWSFVAQYECGLVLVDLNLECE